ncbi:hypothetical protein JW707_03675 [Candidatus Woesearchaeota archaeon]|nr:hypothetical protein [Candidatus Woesearchaeota archaeon]
MTFQRFLRSKKGVEEEGMKPVMGMVLGVIVVIAIIMMVVGGGSLLASEPGGETLRTFRDDFVPALESVVNGSSYDPKTKESYEVVPHLYIKDDQIIAVFSAGRGSLFDTCMLNEEVKKPAECGDSICACICSEKDLCARPYDCFQLTTTTHKTSPVLSIMVSWVFADKDFDANLGDKAGGGEDVLIYGDCDGAGGEPLGIRDILIEKNPTNGIVYISDKTCRKAGYQCRQSYNDSNPCHNDIEMKGYRCPHTSPVCCSS